MRAFIVRPFGVKNGINFDEVEAKLISPALERLGITGRTTIEIVKAGNIRIDMFQRLLTADLVIADLSVHNANVFYELGIRHALRDKRTFMIRSNIDSYPFDLQTDRYFTYDKDNPAASLEGLVEGLRQTRDSEDQDSPVFKLLPNLKAQHPSEFLIVPLDFREEVERAEAEGQVGDLELLASEVAGFSWENVGLRVVGRAQFNSKAYRGARVTWEALKNVNNFDIEANLRLGTIYQKLGELTRSDQELRRVLNNKDADSEQRAEAYSLLASNAKTRWQEEVRNATAEKQRATALRSPLLKDTYENYTYGYTEDLNHFYSGLNALSFLTLMLGLAESLPEVWEEPFDEKAEALRELDLHRDRAKQLKGAVALSIEAIKDRLKREKKKDIWVEISQADLCFLTSSKPNKVERAYRNALEGAPAFARDSVKNRLELFGQLGVREDNVKAALTLFPHEEVASTAAKPTKVLIFTGHMIDDPGRGKKRFPPDKEGIAREEIKKAILKEKESEPIAFGIAGGASGGDILFHEICAELGIATKLYLALPKALYIKASVAPADGDWIERFRRLYDRLPVRVLSECNDESEAVPRWLRDKEDYGIWQRNSLWMLHNALANSKDNITLIALWDGKKGDGPGGTEDLVRQTQERGATTRIISTKELFNLQD